MRSGGLWWYYELEMELKGNGLSFSAFQEYYVLHTNHLLSTVCLALSTKQIFFFPHNEFCIEFCNFKFIQSIKEISHFSKKRKKKCAP